MFCFWWRQSVFFCLCKISRKPLNRFAPNSHGRRVGCLNRASLRVKVGQRSRSSGTKTAFFGLVWACVRLMFSKTSLSSWVLSHWAHFTVLRFTFVHLMYVCIFCMSVYCMHVQYCDMVRWTWWDWSQSLGLLLPSVLWQCWLGHLTCKTRPRYDL